MSTMKSDSQGFLVGERVATRAQPDAMSGVSILRSMRTDVGVIRRLLEAGAGQRMRTAKAQAVTARGRGAAVPVGAVAATVADRRSAGLRTAGAGVATVQGAARGASNMPARDARGRFISTRSEPVVVALQRGAVVPKAGAAATGGQDGPGERDARGRFSGGGGGGGQESSDYAGGDGLLGKISQTLEGIGDVVGNTDQIDPTLAALKEVRDVVSPVGRGVMSLGQRLAERRKERWYDRILKAIKGDKGEGERGGMGGSGADVKTGSFFGTMLGTLGGSAAGAVSGLLGGLLGKAGGALKKGGGLLGGLLGKGGKLLRRIPVLGALIAGGGALASIFGGGTRDEKYTGVGEAGGMLAGGLAGMKAGALVGSFAGPIGTAVGGFLGGVGGALFGEVVGAKVGEWAKTLMDADIPGQAINAWKVTTTALGAAWESLSNDMKAAWSGITEKAGAWWEATQSTAASINEWFKSKTGIDLGEKIGAAADAVGDAAATAWDKAKNAAAAGWSAAKDYAGQAGDAALAVGSSMVPNTVKRAIDAAGKAASALGANTIGAVLETGPGFNVTKNADGSVTRQEGARNWRNNNPGNIEYGPFAKRMGAIATDGRFAVFPDYETGRKAKASLIFEGKSYRDLSLKDAISRYAPPSENDTATYQRTVLASVGGANRKMADYSPAERSAILDAMQRVEGFKTGTVSVVGGAAAAGMRSAPVATVDMASLLPVHSVSVPPSTPKHMPAVQAASIPERLSSSKQPPINVSVRGEVGQDVGDRTIAHVVTGGLGGKY